MCGRACDAMCRTQVCVRKAEVPPRDRTRTDSNVSLQSPHPLNNPFPTSRSYRRPTTMFSALFCKKCKQDCVSSALNNLNFHTQSSKYDITIHR